MSRIQRPLVGLPTSPSASGRSFARSANVATRYQTVDSSPSSFPREALSPSNLSRSSPRVQRAATTATQAGPDQGAPTPAGSRRLVPGNVAPLALPRGPARLNRNLPALDDTEHEQEAEFAPTPSPIEPGNSLWDRFTTAVGSISQTVSNTVESQSLITDPAATPIGSESRITVALKEYYLGRARSGADLPDWLFTSAERQAAGGLSSTRSKAKRDTPAATTGNPELHRPSQVTAKPSSESYSVSSKQVAGTVASRMKQIRDAKRGISSSSEPGKEKPYTLATVKESALDNSAPRSRRAPVGVGEGLPTAPRSARVQR